jgi:cytosine/adenosine deaminase-related metal-dependent hydrolase
MMPDPPLAPRPGYVCSHTHFYSGLAPLGLPAPSIPPENFVQILERVWWRLDRALDPESLRASVRLYVAEALLHGTTTLIDHHESPGFIEGSLDVIADACDELGARALLTFGATERNGGRDEGEAGLAECRRFIRENRRPNVRGVVGLHASFTVSDETVIEAAGLCRELGTVLHVHMAEDGADVDDARARGYAGPLERLFAHDALPAGSILAHGVFLGEAQVRDAAERGVWLVQNPRSNEGNRVGYARSLAASERVALGTDGYPADMPAELAELERIAAAAGETAGAPALRARLEAGHRLATELFGAETLAQDAVVLEAEPEPGPARPGRAPTRARRVRVGGEVVVERGRLTRADLGEIRARAREQAPRLWERMAEID